MAANDETEDMLLTLTADIVAAHVSNNSVAVNDLAKFKGVVDSGSQGSTLLTDTHDESHKMS
jgi:predicted transcriptional regulator